MSNLKQGDKVNYHSIIGREVTSKGHTIEFIDEEANGGVAWITGKSGCVSLDALSLDEN